MSEIKRNEIQTVTDNGSVTYASEVIAVIAGLAAAEVSGIAGMSGGMGISEILGRKNLAKGVRINVVDNRVTVDLACIVTYGVKIHEVCAECQNTVRRAIENMTGLDVPEVNIAVMGIQFDKDQPIAVDAESAE